MLKQLFAGLFALALTAATLPVSTVSATPATYEFNNILDLCLYVQSNGHWFNDANDCSIYANTQTSVVMDYRLLEIDDPVVFNNLDITFTRPNNPFSFRNSGSLTINGGYYSSPSCVLWMNYDNRYTPATFTNRIIINSGIFTANSTSTSSDAPASPVCLISPIPVDASRIDAVINSYLPAGKTFQEVSTTRRTLRANSGTAHVDKTYSNVEGIQYLSSRSVAVVDGPVTPAPEPEPAPETPETPEDTPSETPATPVIPKAPNTGRK
ncbi:hypothetical protein IKL45_02825 [Candidatus Saccharibacteria bacterium]|nr:hypothetical protein [Candidatus Saccharibacteria bacterium]